MSQGGKCPPKLSRILRFIFPSSWGVGPTSFTRPQLIWWNVDRKFRILFANFLLRIARQISFKKWSILTRTEWEYFAMDLTSVFPISGIDGFITDFPATTSRFVRWRYNNECTCTQSKLTSRTASHRFSPWLLLMYFLFLWRILRLCNK